VIAKLADSTYDGKRSANWLKFKCVRDQEFVIGGYTAPKGSRVGLGALLLGYTRAATWFTPASGHRIDEAHAAQSAQGAAIARKQDAPPFTADCCASRRPMGAPGTGGTRSDSANGHATGKLRHPRFQGLRTDKDAGDVVRESR